VNASLAPRWTPWFARDERARIGYAADRTLATLYVVAE
jgi:hypothetical protein